MSVPEPDSLISNGLIIARALLLPSLKTKTKTKKKQQTDKLHNQLGMRLSVYLLAKVCDSSCAHHYV